MIQQQLDDDMQHMEMRTVVPVQRELGMWSRHLTLRNSSQSEPDHEAIEVQPMQPHDKRNNRQAASPTAEAGQQAAGCCSHDGTRAEL